MSQPSAIGPLAQLLGGQDDPQGVVETMGAKDWHEFRVRGQDRSREAGRWCVEHVRGPWTFTVDFGSVVFYIKDPKMAMLFKLTWPVDKDWYAGKS